MAFLDLLIDPSPSGTGFDDTFPTRNTELLSAQIHNTMQDMVDAGGWYLYDNTLIGSEGITIRQRLHDYIEEVFNYAKTAIELHRAGSPVVLTKPAYTDFVVPYLGGYNQCGPTQWNVWSECMKMKYKIYYMWQTEEDPLLVKEYIRDLLNSWPLLDTQINLSDETGQAFRVFPAWNNIE